MNSRQHNTSRHPAHPSRFWTGRLSPSLDDKNQSNDSDLVDKFGRVQLSNYNGERGASQKNPENMADRPKIPDTPCAIAIDRDILGEISERIQSLLEATHALSKRPLRGVSWHDALKELNDEVQRLPGYVEIMQGILEEDEAGIQILHQLRHWNPPK